MIEEELPPKEIPISAPYYLTEKSELSLVDSIIYHMRSSPSLGWLPENIDESELSNEFKPLYNTIWNRQNQESLSNIKLPSWLQPDAKKDPSSILKDTLDMVEHFFTIADFRNNHLTSSNISDILTSIFSADIVNDANLMAVVDNLGIDLLIKSFLTMTPEQKVEAIKQNRDKIEECFASSKGLTSLRRFLLKEYGRNFLTHAEADYSTPFTDLMNCFEADFISKLKNREWKRLEFGYRKIEPLVIPQNNYERYDLINQAAIGVLDLAINYKSISKQISALLCLQNNKGGRFYNHQKIQLAHDFELQGVYSAKKDLKARMTLTSVDEIVDSLIKEQLNALSEMDKADFDFLGVYFDEDQLAYKYITQKESINKDVIKSNTDSIIIFNSQNKKISDEGCTRVLFAHNPNHLAQPYSKKFELFWYEQGEEKTIGDFVRYLALCKFGSEYGAGELFEYLAFSTGTMTFNTPSSKKDLLDSFKRHNFTMETPLSTVIQNLGRNSDSKRIDLFCIEVRETSNYSFDYLHVGSESTINLKPKLQNLLNYLLELEAELSGNATKSKLKDRDLAFYLPNVLIVNVSKVNCNFQISTDMDIDYLKKNSIESLHLSTSFRVTGGIASLTEGNSTFYRPFLISKEEKKTVTKFPDLKGTLKATGLLQKSPEDVVFMVFEKMATHMGD